MQTQMNKLKFLTTKINNNLIIHPSNHNTSFITLIIHSKKSIITQELESMTRIVKITSGLNNDKHDRLIHSHIFPTVKKKRNFKNLHQFWQFYYGVLWNRHYLLYIVRVGMRNVEFGNNTGEPFKLHSLLCSVWLISFSHIVQLSFSHLIMLLLFHFVHLYFFISCVPFNLQFQYKLHHDLSLSPSNCTVYMLFLPKLFYSCCCTNKVIIIWWL